MLYAFTSATANNGSGFAGLPANTTGPQARSGLLDFITAKILTFSTNRLLVFAHGWLHAHGRSEGLEGTGGTPVLQMMNGPASRIALRTENLTMLFHVPKWASIQRHKPI
jgi:hypothetical protein